MSPDPFVHLRVASGYSLQYGASHPHALVERAAEQEMDALALTDRDGTYGAIKHALACQGAGISPILGVDLAVRPVEEQRRTARARTPVRAPARGGTFRDLAPDRGGLPRITFLANASGPGGGRSGWAAICRLVSATHLAGERGTPVADLDLLAPHLATGEVLVLLGPGSELGVAATRRRLDLAEIALAPWREVVPSDCLLVELVSHRLPPTPAARGGTGGSWGPGSSAHAATMAAFGRRLGLGAVLTNAVRYADRLDAPTVDVLDASRRLVALDRRHLDRVNAEGFLKSGKQMHEMAEEICRLAGLGASDREATRLLSRTRTVAERCLLDPRRDLGLGEVHFPELALDPSVLGAGDDERRLSVGSDRRASGGTSDASRNPAQGADAILRARCEGAIGDRYGSAPRQRIWKRLDDELELIRSTGYASYFLTVGDVTDLIREMGVRCAARGSGAGSLVNYLLGISGVDPIRHGLLMERFLSPLRGSLPDIDVDVESARRLEVYEAILDRFGGERCVCVSMMDSYRVRHAVRDVGAALGMAPGEIDAIAKAFPHIRARDARMALRELPELRAAGLDQEQFALLFSLVERLDGLPRHIAVHPCGVLLSDATLLDRTPVEASYAGFPMSQFDKDDVEAMGLLKLDVLGIRMQSAMAHAVAEVSRVDGIEIDLDDEAQVPFDDPETFSMISNARTLGVFQIESPGQRELVAKSGIDTFAEIIADISLFRPGPVKSDMITPYLEAKQGWKQTTYLHPDLEPILGETHGVVVFHEQVIEIIARFARISYAEADERRRALGDFEGMAETKVWFFPRALGHGYPLPLVTRIWAVLEAFASFGFCKAHAAAFALPTYQSAWLKAHWPAHFLAGVLTHDPGMYPKRLILDDARQHGIAVLGLDVNRSEKDYVVERLDGAPAGSARPGQPGWGSAYGIRIALAEVKGIGEAEIDRITTARPFTSLTDFWHRARVSRPILERLVLAGGFDRVYALGERTTRGRVTRRDLLLQVSELERFTRAVDRGSRGRGRALAVSGGQGLVRPTRAREQVGDMAARNSSDPQVREDAGRVERHALAAGGVWARAAAQSQATATPDAPGSVQLALDLGDAPGEGEVSGLPEMSRAERMAAELEILGLDVSSHVVDGYSGFLDVLGVTRSRDLLHRRSRAELLVAGVKVATQTPPVRSGRRVIFLTLDDATGPVDATFFEDAQGPYAATVFHTWLLLVRGELRRTGHRGASLRATGAWDLAALHEIWQREGMPGVQRVLETVPEGFGVGERTESGEDRRRVLVHTSGYQISPYADIKPAGGSAPWSGGGSGPAPGRGAAGGMSRKLWHRSPGSAG